VKIREQNEQRIVITPWIGDLFFGRSWRLTIFLFIFISLSISILVVLLQIGNPVWGTLLLCILVLVALLLYLLGEIAGKKIVIDKPTASVIFTKRLFMLISRKHFIPFSLVQRMHAEHKTYNRGGMFEFSAYEVSIELRGVGRIKTKRVCPKCGDVYPDWRASCLTCGTMLREVTKGYDPKMVTVFQTSKVADASNAGKMIGSLIGTDVYNRVEGG